MNLLSLKISAIIYTICFTFSNIYAEDFTDDSMVNKIYVTSDSIYITPDLIFVYLEMYFIPVSAIAVDSNGFYFEEIKAGRVYICSTCNKSYNPDNQEFKCPHNAKKKPGR